MINRVLALNVCVGLFLSSAAIAKVEIKKVTDTTEVVEAAPAKEEVKKEHAQSYFRRSSASVSSDDHYLGLHLGVFLDSDAYKWGPQDRASGAGRMTFGVTYRMGEWTNSMDLLFRGDISSYEIGSEKATKISLLPMITFPDATSKFPLYFGAGVGLGVFFKQLAQESSLSFDYQLVAGARFFDLFQNTGFFVETGLKNQVLLLSDGQFNGVFFALGTVFTF